MHLRKHGVTASWCGDTSMYVSMAINATCKHCLRLYSNWRTESIAPDQLEPNTTRHIEQILFSNDLEELLTGDKNG